MVVVERAPPSEPACFPPSAVLKPQQEAPGWIPYVVVDYVNPIAHANRSHCEPVADRGNLFANHAPRIRPPPPTADPQLSDTRGHCATLVGCWLRILCLSYTAFDPLRCRHLLLHHLSKVHPLRRIDKLLQLRHLQ